MKQIRPVLRGNFILEKAITQLSRFFIHNSIKRVWEKVQKKFFEKWTITFICSKRMEVEKLLFTKITQIY